MTKGSCLCGGVSFDITGPLRPVVMCHCTQCRKQSGHVGAFTACDDKDLHFTCKDTLAWYRASDLAGRGFCKNCGSLLFWKGDGKDYISITAGSLDKPTGLAVEGHIYCADKGDYYEIKDGDYQLPQG
ncbi:MAG: GFA family protein [Hyphomicrobiales bacterium]